MNKYEVSIKDKRNGMILCSRIIQAKNIDDAKVLGKIELQKQIKFNDNLHEIIFEEN